MNIGKDEFRSALSRFASGVTIVTTTDSEGFAHGITVSAFSSVSLDPPLILVCIQKTAGSHAAFLEGGSFVVHFLGEGQDELSNLFASKSHEKFEGVSHHEGPNGVLVLDDALAVLECTVEAAHDAGDHTIFVGLVEKTSIKEGKPLIYWNGGYRKLNSDS